MKDLFISHSGYVADFETHGDKLVVASHAKFYSTTTSKFAKTVKLPTNIKWEQSTPSFIYEGDIIKQMLDNILLDESKVIFVYFHNLKGFDGHFIIPWLISNGYKHNINGVQANNQFSTIEVLGSILAITLMCKDKIVTFFDSLAHLPMKLAEAAQLFAPNELKLNPRELLKSINIHFDDDEAAKDYFYKIDPLTASAPLFHIYKRYTMQDVTTLATILTTYMSESNQYIPRSVTASSMSVKTLRSEEQDQFALMQLDFTEDNLNWMRIAKPLYRGGYTNTMINYEGQIFKSVTYYDINSDYPHIMTGNLPIGVPQKVTSTYKLQDDEVMFYDIIISEGRLRKDHFAIIPDNSNLKYAYNITKPISMYVYDEELEYFKKFYKGLKYRILNRYVLKTRKILDKFITTRYERRQQIKSSHPALAHGIKLVLNSLYGKTGELWVKPITAYVYNGDELSKWKKERTWVYWKDQKLQEQEHGHPYIVKTVKQVRYEGDVVMVQLEHANPNNAITLTKNGEPTKKLNMFIAGYITTKARCRLYQANLWALETGNKALYCDTDSIIATGKNLAAFEAKMGLDNKKLGMWKVEHSNAKFIAAQPKRYVINNTPTSGGYSHLEFKDMSELKNNKINMTKYFSKKTKHGKIISVDESDRYFIRSEKDEPIKYTYNSRTGELRKEIISYEKNSKNKTRD